MSCDARRSRRVEARALYLCRAGSCDLTLGGDDACADEEAAFRAAESHYGACVVAAAKKN